MKGKPTWKPMGLSAKKWHESGHTPGAANVSPMPAGRMRKRRKAMAQWPMEHEKQEAGKTSE